MPTETGVVGSAGKEQAAAETEEHSNSKLIRSVNAMWSSADLKAPTTKTLKDWMVETTTNINNEKFWLLNAMKMPAEPLEKLCPRGKSRATVVFLLTLWARFSPCCRAAINRCLGTGVDQWKEGSCWLHFQAFVLSIRIQVWHILPQLQAREKEKTETQSGLNTLQLEAHCLNQAVVNSSKMFRMFSNQNPTHVVLIFHSYLKHTKPQSKFHKNLNKFNFDYQDEDKESVTHVSIADFLHRNILLHLRAVLALEEMKELFSHLRKSQVVVPSNVTDAESAKLSSNFLAKMEGPTTKVLEKLGVSAPTNDFVVPRLLGFAIYAERFLKSWGGTDNLVDKSQDEEFMRRLFKAGILVKEKKTMLKNLVEDKHPPLFDRKAACLLIISGKALDDKVVEPGQQKIEKRGKDDKDAGDKNLRENSGEQPKGSKGTGPFKKRKNNSSLTPDTTPETTC